MCMPVPIPVVGPDSLKHLLLALEKGFQRRDQQGLAKASRPRQKDTTGTVQDHVGNLVCLVAIQVTAFRPHICKVVQSDRQGFEAGHATVMPLLAVDTVPNLRSLCCGRGNPAFRFRSMPGPGTTQGAARRRAAGDVAGPSTVWRWPFPHFESRNRLRTCGSKVFHEFGGGWLPPAPPTTHGSDDQTPYCAQAGLRIPGRPMFQAVGWQGIRRNREPCVLVMESWRGDPAAWALTAQRPARPPGQ